MHSFWIKQQAVCIVKIWPTLTNNNKGRLAAHSESYIQSCLKAAVCKRVPLLLHSSTDGIQHVEQCSFLSSNHTNPTDKRIFVPFRIHLQPGKEVGEDIFNLLRLIRQKVSDMLLWPITALLNHNMVKLLFLTFFIFTDMESVTNHQGCLCPEPQLFHRSSSGPHYGWCILPHPAWAAGGWRTSCTPHTWHALGETRGTM